jgi:hypothetical protein
MSSIWGRAGATGVVLATAMVAVELLGVPSGAQQVVAVPIVQQGADTASAVSDDGNIVVFRSADVNGATSIVVHNRVSAISAALPGGPFGAELGEPAVSGDGCVVAYPVSDIKGDPPVPDGLAIEGPGNVRVIDRCLDPALPKVLDSIAISSGTSISSPALSLDGSVLAVSNGQDILRFVRAAPTTYDAAESFDGPTPSSDAVLTAEGLDVSDDGAVVVFASGADPKTPSTLTVNAWTAGAVSALEDGAWSPTVSGDGRIVAYEDPNGVAVRDRIAATGSPAVNVAPKAVRPVISGDGHHVVHELDGSVRVVSWIGQGLAPFDATSSRAVSGLTAPTVSGAAIDRFGATVVSDVTEDRAGVVERDVAVSVTALSAGFSAKTFDLGRGDVGAVLDATVTFTNDGPASVGVGSVTVVPPFVIGDNRCVVSIRPQSTCTVEISVKIERYEDVFGVVTINGIGNRPSYTTEVMALGVAPPATTPTTTPGTTTGDGTTGVTTGGTTTGGTTGGTTTGSTGGRPTTTTGGGPTTTTGGRPTSTTGSVPTTSLLPGAAVTFSPSTFDFAPTIVSAGRRTGSIELVNSSTRSVSIVGVRLEPAPAGGVGPFEIVSTTCAGQPLAASGRCSIDLVFAPTTTGAQNVQVIAQLEGGTELTAAVSGTGAPPPTLTVIPGVATVGQVVTISGGGFPTGITVGISWGDDVVPLEAIVDETGAFNLPIIVRPNTPTGPTDVVVAGQDELFADVTATMLVTATSDRTSPGVLDGVGPNVGR